MQMGKWLWLVGLPWISACGPRHYQPPSATLPSALLRIEAVYDTAPSLRDRQPEQQVLIDGRSIAVPETLPESRSWARDLRVPPGFRQFAFRAYFEHAELRNEMIRPSVPACTPMRTSGYVFNDCATLTQAQPTSIWAWETDADCEASAFLEAKRGEEIRLKFHFEGHNRCRVECVRRGPGASAFSACSSGP
jgi:hypothetical protein